MNSDANGATSPLQGLIDRAPTRAIQVQVLVLCTLVTLIEGVDLSLIPLLSASITKALSLSAADFGYVLSALPFGLMIGGVTMGYIGDRIGRRPALVVAMALMTLSTLLTAFVHTIPELLVCRILTGIAFGGVIPAAMALVSEFTAFRIRTNALALVALGAAGGQLLASRLIKLSFAAGPWQAVVVDVAVGCGVVTVLLILFLPESPRYLLLRNQAGDKLQKILRRLQINPVNLGAVAQPDPAVRENQFVELFRSGRATGTLLLWGTFIGVCAVVSFFSNSLTFLYLQGGKPNSLAQDALGAYAFGAIVGGLLLPLFARRWHPNRVLIGAIVAAVVVTLCQGWVLPMDDRTNLIVVSLCGAFVSGAFFILYPPAVGFYPTAIRSTGIGAAIAVGRIGNIVTPAVAGVMLNAGHAASTVFVTMAAPLLLSCIAMVVFHRVTANAAHA